jgi:hypothetical protein
MNILLRRILINHLNHFNPMDENNLNPDVSVAEEATTTQVEGANTPSSDVATATPTSTVKTPFDKGVVTSEAILATKPVEVTSGKNQGTIQYVITTKSGKEIWNNIPPSATETTVSFGLTEKGYTNFIGFSSFQSLTLEEKYAKATALARANAIASQSIVEESKAPDAMASLLQINIKDLL